MMVLGKMLVPSLGHMGESILWKIVRTFALAPIVNTLTTTPANICVFRARLDIHRNLPDKAERSIRRVQLQPQPRLVVVPASVTAINQLGVHGHLFVVSTPGRAEIAIAA
jgi:hypothetical protein